MGPRAPTWSQNAASAVQRDRGGCRIGYCQEYRVFPGSPNWLFNIKEDPSESTPIDPDSALYGREWAAMSSGITEHLRTVTRVPNQIATAAHRSGRSTTPARPWLFPCCNPPSCTCDNDPYTTTRQTQIRN